MLKQLLGGLAMATALALPAQSPLSTIFASNNGGSAGWTMYFDVVVNAPLTFTQFDVNTGAAASTTGSIDVYYTTSATTYVGNDVNAGAWTLGGSGPCVSAGLNLPTPCAITPFTLAPGNYGIAIVHNGIYPSYTDGNGTAVPGSGTNQTYSTAELTVLCGASAGGGLGTAICCTPRVINMNVYYTVSGSGTIATRTPYGSGCVARYSSFYEHFTTTPSIDLSNSSFTMLNTGTGYLVYPGSATFLAPSATATNLNLGDDTTATVTLASPLNYPGGSTTSLVVCSNGFVSTATNGTSYQPTPAAFLAWANTAWCVWRDFICNATGNVWFEQVGSVACITWNGVIGYVGTTAGTTPSTFQFQFDLSNGNVSYVFQSMDTVSVSTWTGGEGWVVGYSPGGASQDPGSRDLTATVPGTFSLSTTDLAPLSLAASARPLAGTTINLNTSNITPTAPFGAVLFGLVNPAFDLTPLGMPGCSQYTDGFVTMLFLPFGSPTASTAFNVPNMLGLHVLAQSFCYDPTAALTPLGAVASNGIDLGIGNL